MLFNSLNFAIFLPIVFILYWFVTSRNLKIQNILILGASYFFYGCWDWRFLSLIAFSTIVDFFVGIGLESQKKTRARKLLLCTSIAVNLGFLGIFKYYNFFLDNINSTAQLFGLSLNLTGLNVILPVGISFYTFQTLSYSIDVYNRKLQHTRDFVAFAAFVSFFPQLVAGPIERATNLLPQFYKKRTFNYHQAIDGLRQILWGLFKKVVIADNCAEYANLIFNNSSDYSGSALLLGAVFFAFQIYGDFSGYSDIAIGVSRLFGINLCRNFAFPYFSRDAAEFWRRWHISLSTWFRDYLYIPLGGSKGGPWISFRNVMIIFLVSGFWHGANWTFVCWGALNALYFLPLLLLNKNRTNLDVVSQGRLLPSPKEVIQIMSTFSLTVLAWIFFRAENIPHAMRYIGEICSSSLFAKPQSAPDDTILILLGVFLVIEWFGRSNEYAIEKLFLNWKRCFRWLIYYALIAIIFRYGGSEQVFIYFQF